MKIQVSIVLRVWSVSASNSMVAPYSSPVASSWPRARRCSSVSFEKSRLRA
jgi:hypothetical protein